MNEIILVGDRDWPDNMSEEQYQKEIDKLNEEKSKYDSHDSELRFPNNIYANTRTEKIFSTLFRRLKEKYETEKISHPNLTQKWKFSTKSPVKSCICINNLVLFWAEQHGLFALDEYSGEEVWHFNTKAGLQIYGQITIDEHIVYCVSNDNIIYSLDIKSGDLIWSIKLEEIRYSKLVVSNSILIAYNSFGLLIAIDTKTGTVKWSKPNCHFHWVLPCVFENTIICQGTKEFIFAYNIFDGSKLWEYRVEENDVHQYQGIDAGNEYLFITGPRDIIEESYYIYAIRPSTGKLAWKSINGGYTSRIKTHKSLLFCWYRDVQLCALDQNTGLLKWKINSHVYSSSKPIIHKNLLIYGTHSEYLSATNPDNGDEIWKYHIPSLSSNNNNSNNILAITSNNSNLIIVGTLDANVYALEVLFINNTH